MKKLLSTILVLMLIVTMIPVFASAEESVSKVSIRTYPDSSYGYDNNQVPLVGQDASYIYALVSNGAASLNNYYLLYGGSVATGALKYETYTFCAEVTPNAGYIFDASTTASVNNESANISVSSDGMSATITINMLPRAEAPRIAHEPTDETHNAGEVFSFVASATNYDTFQWYLVSPYNATYKAEEVGSVGLSGTVSDLGTSVRWNLHTVPADFNGWRVYCVFTGIAGQTQTRQAYINVNGAADPYQPVYVGVSPTPAASSGIWIVETPEPSSDIWIVETPEPSNDIWIVETPEPTTESAAADDTSESENDTAKSSHKGLKVAACVLGGIAVLGGGLLGTQYVIDKNKRKKRAKRASTGTNVNAGSNDYKGRH